MGQRALIVDDAYFMRNLIKKVLKEAGYEIVGEAKNGKEGISLYFDLKPDFVTMDINMPDMSGIEVTRQILSQDPNAKIIAVTGSDNDQVKTDMLAAGAKGYLKKPFQPAFLLTKIEEMFSSVEEEEIAVPIATELVIVEETSKVDETDDFFGTEIQLLNKPDESRVVEVKIENEEDRIEFPNEEVSSEEKEKYALVGDETTEPFMNESDHDSEEQVEEDPGNNEAFSEEVESEEVFEITPSHNDPSSEAESFNHTSMEGNETVEETNEEEVHKGDSEESFVPDSNPLETTTTTVAEIEPHSYLQIRPPRGKVLSNPALHEQNNSTNKDDDMELIINSNGEVEQVSSQKKGFLSFFTNLFKIK